MRTYIFTDLERRILNKWLNGQLTLKDIRLQKVLSRVRLFKALASDVDLFIRVRSRLAEPESAAST
jgi:hypothetical protein